MKADLQLGEMHDRLMDFHRQNPREGLGNELLMYIEDPLKPRDEHGRFRVNPILLLLAVVLALVFCAFLFFSVVRS
ncbi:MAG TPA: hypothetical protein VN946_05070 [Terriglobales bacterium]|jgi:hypothetical protein|nr:hypothetical protein [Terriglobales bacterium]